MHEVAIISNLFQRLRKEISDRVDVQEVEVIFLKIGEMSCASPAALQSAFEVARTETEFEETELEIDRVPLKIHCQSCDTEVVVDPGPLNCPDCGSRKTKIVSGDSLYLDSIQCR